MLGAPDKYDGGGRDGASSTEAGEESPARIGPTPLLPCAPIEDIEPLAPGQRWLVDRLWAAQGVGVLGGPPKAGKSWLALDLALSVASGTPALSRFSVATPGPVLLFPAEDGPAAIRARVDGLARARGLSLHGLPLLIITADTVRLDDPIDREALTNLVEKHTPKLLILDPLVRLHSGDENHSGHVSELLLFLRQLQRRFGVAIVVTHHVAKRRGGHPGESLRGSSDLHAWGDSNAYLQRRKDGAVLLTLEHRFAPSPEPIVLRLIALETGGAQLEILDETGVEEEAPTEGATAVASAAHQPIGLADRVVAFLGACERPMSQVKIRKALRVRNAELTATLRRLQAEGSLASFGRMGGWQLIHPSSQALEQDAGGDKTTDAELESEA